MSQLEKRGKDEKWREINIVGLAGASCFIWQIAAQYPYGPVITQESRANKEKSRPLLPLFLLSNTFSHSPSIRYKPFSFLFLGTHCLLSFLPPRPPLLTSSSLSPPPSVPPEGISSRHLQFTLKEDPGVLHRGTLAAWGRMRFVVGASLDRGKGLQKSPL